MEIDAIIFDMDGTVADTIPLTVYALKETVRELTGKQYSDDEIKKEFGPTDIVIIKKLVDNDKREISPEVYIEHFDRSFERFIKPIEGINELLNFIKSRGIKTGLFTGRSRVVTDLILKRLGISEKYDVIVTGDMTCNPKPDPEGILKALGALNADSSKSIYVGDFDVDISASKAAGVKSVLALWASTGEESLLKHNPDLHFKSTYDFMEWLIRNNI